MRYLVQIAGKTHGPHLAMKIRKLPGFTGECLICEEGTADWVPAKSVAKFRSHPSRTTAPAARFQSPFPTPTPPAAGSSGRRWLAWVAGGALVASVAYLYAAKAPDGQRSWIGSALARLRGSK